MYRTGPLIVMLAWLSPPLHRMSGSWEKTQHDLALASREGLSLHTLQTHLSSSSQDW